MKAVLLQVLVSIGILAMDACTIHREVIVPRIDPSNAIALSEVIVFSGNTQQMPGQLPSSPGCTVTNTVILNNPTISLTNGGSSVFLPIQFSGTTPITSVFVQVKGANTYFQVPIASPVATGIIYIPLSLPASVIDGTFTLNVVLAGAGNCVAGKGTLTIPVTVTQPLACDGTPVDGSSGITQTIHALNRTNGKVSINYDTLTEPDRIDVYLDGVWVKGTSGTSSAPPPPLSPCKDATGSYNYTNGFVGTKGTRNFTFDVSASNRQVQVYVSGCTGGSTLWTYTLTCQ